MSRLNERIFYEINKLREDPKRYIPKLEAWKKHYEGKIFKHPDGRNPLKTVDGVLAVTKAINALNKQEKREPLKGCSLLDKAAKAHANDIGPKGIVSNNSTSGFCRRGANVKTRLQKHGHIIKCFGESIAVSTKNADEVMI